MKNWEDKYLLNISWIDKQHRGFFELLDDEIVRQKNPNKEEMLALINKLEAYLKNHFFVEEELLNKANYPEIIKHKEQHSFFIQKIAQMKLELKYDNQFLYVKLVDFMKRWFLSHILLSDKKYDNAVKNYLDIKTDEE